MTLRTKGFGSMETRGEPHRAAPRNLRFEVLESRRVLAVGFDLVGTFDGLQGQAKVLNNPTSLEFGPDGRLYVSEQNGQVNAFTVELQEGEYLATAHEELLLADGSRVVQSIQNHNDDGSLASETNRQVTGLVTAGTAEHPVLYVSSSDPRISTNADAFLDTNSGIVTRLTWNGSDWESLDIVRGLPRSEENHSVNGMELSPDGLKLYVQVGGHTNNGAPSKFFAYTAEYALSGALLEIDLMHIDQLPILTDAAGGQGGLARSYVYDLPTLDDPSVPNDGVREDVNGMDVAGPWGGNDGFNMAVLPSDAPLRIYADGFRNAYDVVLTQSGHFFTIDNGSNSNLGGDPIPDEFGEATQLPNNGGTGAAEPLFRIEDGAYYGHPNPTRANQDLDWTVYDDTGVADNSVSPHSVHDLSSLVPSVLANTIPVGMLIDPTKFTGDASRLAESGIRIPYDDPSSPALASLGTSTNGIIEYTDAAFDGALQGALVTAQFNGNITLLNLNATSDGIEPLIGPGSDGVLGTPDDEVIDSDGIYPLFTGQSVPLDLTMGPDGTIWVAEFGPDNIRVIAPTDLVLPDDPDFDNDGLLNTIDPFIRDASNGGQLVLPGQTYRWDFDANQDDNLPGPNGYGGGLTGVMVNGTIDYEQFFQADSTLPDQIINLDNVKFTTAAGGGTTVIESVSNGDPSGTQNDGEFLFHTGVTIAPTVESFHVRWTLFNPGDALTGSSQQIGGYLGTGEQNNFLKVVATPDPNGEILISLEDGDSTSDTYLQANDLFDVAEAEGKRIFIDLLVDPIAETATPTIIYETQTGESTIVGSPISLTGTAVMDAIDGSYSIAGETTGLAVGLFSSNVGQPESGTFQAIFDDIEISAIGTAPTTLYRVNAGGLELPSADSGPRWLADTETNPSIYLDDLGDNRTSEYPAIVAGPTVPAHVPAELFTTERDDKVGIPNMSWAFEAPLAGDYVVNLFFANGSATSDEAGDRRFDVAIEGSVPSNLDDVDPTELFGHEVGGIISNVVTVTDGELNVEFLHEKKRPQISGIEITLLIPPGAAELAVTADVDLVQQSSFSADSFLLSNTGNKRITRVDLDITHALYADVAFDPFGVAGDTTSKPLQIDTAGSTGVVDTALYSPYTGIGGTAGFKGLTLLFDTDIDSGFEPGETLGFSIDIDSNSIAGADKSILDAGADPPWDVGGVSGAELIGSTFTITFEDGTTANGQLHGVGNQAGSRGVATQDSPELEATLTANGVAPGEFGTYNSHTPVVVVDGPTGHTARVVLTKGILQPTDNLFSEPYASQLDAQLEVLATADFPANNAAHFQTVDILLTGAPQDIGSLFDFSGVPGFELAGDEDKVPLGFVASIIDPSDADLPLGPVTDAIYLHYRSGSNSLPVAEDDTFSTVADTVLNANLFSDNGAGIDFDPDASDTIHVSAVNGAAHVEQLLALESGATVMVWADGTFIYDPNGAFDHLDEEEIAFDRFYYAVTDSHDVNSAAVTIAITGSIDSLEGMTLLAVDATADATFGYEIDGTPHLSHSLSVDNAASRGIAVATDGSQSWVVDVDRNVYIYSAEGTLLSQWEFTDIASPEGIAVAGSDLWIVSKLSDEVYYFASGADLTTGTHTATSSFSLAAENDVPTGLATDGSSLWVTNDSTDQWRVFKYDVVGTPLGDWELDSGNRNARGIALDPTNPSDVLVVNDGATNALYRYANAASATSGSFVATDVIPLDAANDSPQGIALVIAAEQDADFDDDGDVDGSDFLQWQRQVSTPNEVGFNLWLEDYGSLAAVVAPSVATDDSGTVAPVAAAAVDAAIELGWLEVPAVELTKSTPFVRREAQLPFESTTIRDGFPLEATSATNRLTKSVSPEAKPESTEKHDQLVDELLADVFR
ncbi:MAG: malectin domain-containing carbohydrate-binding protein [Planctomycetota bacterium]